MKKEFLTSEKVFLQESKFADVLISSNGYVDFHEKLSKSDLDYRGAKGEGFEIFKHVLRGDEIESLKSIDDMKVYVYKHLDELEEGILKTYSMSAMHSFEQLGMGIESKKLPLHSILQFITIDNNIADFR